MVSANDTRIVAQTADWLWWVIPSCLDCDTDDAVATHVLLRLWGCYTENQLELISDDVRDVLRLSVCAPEPAAAG